MVQFDEISDFHRRQRHITTQKCFQDITSTFDSFIDFFDNLEMLISGRNINPFIGRGKVYLLDTQLLRSAMFTLNSIKLCIEYGSISDCNTLMRKLRDDLFFYLYLLEVDNNQVVLFSECESFERVQEHNKQLNYVINWFNNELRNFDFKRNVITYLRKNKLIDQVIRNHNIQSEWDRISQNLNNYVHNNGLSFCVANYEMFSTKKIELILKEVTFKLEYIILVFVTLFILIKPHYIMASDYIEYMEVSMTPPEGCEYWVAPFIQDFVDRHIGSHSIELKKFIQSNIYMDLV
ncbi:hypothetical protein CM49_05541 [Paenibacillus sp. P1XP2]|nr:hypothetical protein CM49_05541 [Paenibacillus sp. P1XP2]